MNFLPELIIIHTFLITILFVLVHERLFTLKEFLISLSYLVIVIVVSEQSSNWTELLMLLLPLYVYKMYVLVRKLRTWLLPALFFVFQMTSITIFWSLVFDTRRWLTFHDLVPRNIDIKEAIWASFLQVIVTLIVYFSLKRMEQKKKWIYHLLDIKKKFRVLALSCLSILLLFLFFHSEAVSHSNYLLYFYTTINLVLLLLGLIIGISVYNHSVRNEQRLAQLMTSFKDEQKKNEWNATFRHDYRSWLIGLAEYIRKEDLPAAKEMLTQIIDYSEPLYDEGMYLLVTQLSSVPLQGLLFDFYQRCKERKIVFELKTINDWFFHEISLIDFLRMLSVILNNALEEVSTLPSVNSPHKITCEFMKKESGYRVLVKNPAEKKKSMIKIKEKGFSTKKKHKGLGLASLYTIANQYRNIDITVRSNSQEFSVQLDIEK